MFNLFGSDSDNALDLLKHDHEEVKKLFDEYEDRKEDADAASKIEIVQTICQALAVHAQVEEDLFYPAVRKAEDSDDLLDEAQVEHQTLKDLIAQLQNSDPDEPLYDAKVKVLSEYVLHHVREEESEIFSKAKSAGVDLDALGRKMKSRKEALMQEGDAVIPGAASDKAPRAAKRASPASKSGTARKTSAKSTRGTPKTNGKTATRGSARSR